LINLLQQIVRNHSSLQEDKEQKDKEQEVENQIDLEELIGRNLVNLCLKQANLVVPFESVNLFGIFMQMHSFFATFPFLQKQQQNLQKQHQKQQQNVIENMEKALFVIAKSMFFEGRLKCLLDDLPLESIVRDKIQQMEFLFLQEKEKTTNDTTTTNSSSSNLPAPITGTAPPAPLTGTAPPAPPPPPAPAALSSSLSIASGLTREIKKNSSYLISPSQSYKKMVGPQENDDDDVDMEIPTESGGENGIARKLWAKENPIQTSRVRASTIGPSTMSRPSFSFSSSSSKDLEALMTSSSSSIASLSNLKDRLERIRTKHQ
jgi:hypothetical protein